MAAFYLRRPMNLISDNIPTHWLWPLWLAAAAMAWLILRRARWAMLRDPHNLHVFLGAAVAVLSLWLIKTGIKPGLSFHLLGAAALTLMFRPLFALFAIGLISAGLAIWQGQYAAIPANWLLMGAVPVSVSWGIYRLVDSKLPNHLFVYIFLNAFFGAALSAVAVGLAATVFDAVAGTYPLHYLLDEYLPYYLLLAWSEAFATGMLITIMVIYRPEWVATFDDRRYIDGK
jgi:uncharacterized membrane protein